MELHLVRPPLAASYVVFLPVLAGPSPAAADARATRERLDRVLGQDVEVLIDLTEPGEAPPYADDLPARVQHLRFAMPRGAVPPAATVSAALEAIGHHAVRDGVMTYVHDANGVDRVGVVIGCWLASMGMGAGDPLSVLELLRRRAGLFAPSPAHDGQRALVAGWPVGGRAQRREVGMR